MFIKRLIVGRFQTNCYILGDESTGEAAVIDPGDNAQGILDLLDSTKMKTKYVILTHGHYDHISAAREILDATGAKLAAFCLESEMLKNTRLCLQYLFTKEPFEPLIPDLEFKNGDMLRLGSLELKIMHTPGHTKGSCCIICGYEIFCGDTIFFESIGRTDFPTGDSGELRKTLKALAELAGDFRLYPGHGEQTTLSHERRYNSYLS